MRPGSDMLDQGEGAEAEARSLAVSRIARRPGGRVVFALACACLLAVAGFAGSAAPSALAEGACPNEAIRIEQGSTFLPDCRAYELVSPPEKIGADVMVSPSRTRAAADGSAVAFASLGTFAEPVGSGVATEYLTRRTGEGSTGWTTHAITPKAASSTIIAALAGPASYVGEFSENLDTGVFTAFNPLTDEPKVAGAANLYRRGGLRSTAGSSELITQCPGCTEPLPGGLLGKVFQPGYAGASSDFGQIAFDSAFPLTADAGFLGLRRAYEWNEGTVEPLGVLPNGAFSLHSSVGGNGARGGTAAAERTKQIENPVSSDGSRIAFTALEGSGGQSGDIYLRIDGRATVPINVSQLAVPEEHEPATYWDMSRDGRRIFFTSPERLTADAPSDPGSASKLYVWKQAESNETQRVSVTAEGGTFTLAFNEATTGSLAFDADAETVQHALEALPTIGGGNVSVSGGPAVAGESGSYEVTFEGDFAGAHLATLVGDGSALTGASSAMDVNVSDPISNLEYVSANVGGLIGASDSGDYAYFTGENSSELLVWHDGDVSSIGALSREDAAESNVLGKAVNLGSRQSYVTPDGHYLMFSASSGAGLLSRYGKGDYDQNGHSELYVYGAEPAELWCVSCDPSGAPAQADAASREDFQIGAAVPSEHVSRTVSADGRYAFFSTPEALVPRDTNGTWDAYRFDLRTGRPELLSTGVSPEPSFFLDSSANGADAFIATKAQLVGWDVDQNYDLYDVRVDGGFAEPPPGAGGCAGESCRGSVAAPPPAGNLGSQSATGAGNPKPNRRKSQCRKSKSKQAKAKQGKGPRRQAGHGAGRRCAKHPAKGRKKRHHHRHENAGRKH